MNRSPYHLFIIDAVGAMMSALLLGLALPALPTYFGMPTTTLHGLAVIAIVFSLYSFSCFFLQPTQWWRWLRGIASANILYCGYTLWLLGEEWQLLTAWDIAYFVGEVVLVLSLAGYELWRAGQKR